MKNRVLSALVISLALLPQSGLAARDAVWAVGSSTVYPFVTASAGIFGQKTSFKTPIVESTGTGGGIKIFCDGTGEKFPDIANASRAIKSSEKEQCEKSGVKNVVELKIGLDGLVLANSAGSERYKLTKPQIFLALAREVPVKGKLEANPYKTWKQVDASLPDVAIEVYGPPPTSGTRDAFVEMVMHEGCKEFAEFEKAYPDKKAREKACGVLREDGAFIEAGENDNLIIQKLVSNPKALGIFGYSFLEENTDKVQGSIIGGVEPSYENVSAGSYPITRPLFIYVKADNFASTPGLKAFVEEMASDGASGNEGYLTEKGLIPLHEKERAALKKTVQNLPK